MIHNALTGEVSSQPRVQPKTLAQQNTDFTAEGAPPPVNGAHATPLAIGIATARPNGVVVIEDWDTMLSAVTARLRLAAGLSSAQQPNGTAPPHQAIVLECADALDRLHAAWGPSLARRTQSVSPDGAAASES